MSERKLNLRSMVVVLCSCGLAVPAPAAAGGFQLNEHSAPGLARAFADNGLADDDASSVFYNPAAMVYLDGPQVQLGSTLVSTSGRFSNRGSVQTLGSRVQAGKGAGSNGGGSALVPHLFLVRPINERIRVGLGITAPFGLSTDYDAGWIGRYHALESELVTVDVNPAVAVRVSERVSIGAGVSMQYADVTLSRALFLPGPGGQQLPDGFAEVQGDSWAVGWNLGVAWEPNERVRLGVGYRSRMSHDFRGHRRIDGVPGAQANVGVDADADLPESLYLGMYGRLHPRLALTLGARWTRWSRFDELRVRFDDGSPDDVTPERWENSWTAGAGLDWRINPRWVASAGVSLDRTPVPNRRLRTPRIPDADRTWVTAGVTWQPNRQWRLQLSAAHLFVDEARIDTAIDLVPHTVAPPGTFTDRLTGELSSPRAELVSLQVLYRLPVRRF